MAPPILVSFHAGADGPWAIERIDPVVGDGLAAAPRLTMTQGRPAAAPPSLWTLQGVTSNERYVERPERARLTAIQQPLGRPEATCAALIPIHKSEAWWDLTQEERRGVVEAQSHHIAVGLEYLPAVARRLHHGRDMGGAFDFLTWFEFAPEAAADFEELVARLRSTEEWSYVDREVDIRLRRLVVR